MGLGNIWRFPYVAGQNGGGAFVLIYLLCVVVLGVPLLLAEVAMGKMTRKGPDVAILTLAKENDRSRFWSYLGLLNILAGFLILCYYTVISGWVLDYLVKAGGGMLANVNHIQSENIFNSFMHNPVEMLVANTVMIAGMTIIGMLGVKNGLEKAVLWLFPILIVLM